MDFERVIFHAQKSLQRGQVLQDEVQKCVLVIQHWLEKLIETHFENIQNLDVLKDLVQSQFHQVFQEILDKCLDEEDRILELDFVLAVLSSFSAHRLVSLKKHLNEKGTGLLLVLAIAEKYVKINFAPNTAMRVIEENLEVYKQQLRKQSFTVPMRTALLQFFNAKSQRLKLRHFSDTFGKFCN